MNRGAPFMAVTLLCLLSCLAGSSTATRPVILVHGLTFHHLEGMQKLYNTIREELPGTDVYLVKTHADETSLTTPMWSQVNETYKEIEQRLQSAGSDGVTFICYSQGGLVCRGIIEAYSHHNVHTFISLSSPQMGQFGVTNFGKLHYIPRSVRKYIYRLFYTTEGQKNFSLANYWNDPYHQDLYHKYCTFLPHLNNASNPDYKANFLNLKQLVLVGGPDDEVITPWQSSIFGFYNENDDSTVLDMKDQKEIYQADSFGLQTLSAAGNVSVCIMPNVTHLKWPTDTSTFEKCIKPWLS